MKILFSRRAIMGFALLPVHGLAASAAEVKVTGGLAMRAVLGELGPQFARASGRKLAIAYRVRGSIRERIDAGEAFTSPCSAKLLWTGISKRARSLLTCCKSPIRARGSRINDLLGASKRNCSWPKSAVCFFTRE